MTIPSGISQQFWVKTESTFDTVSAIAATDAINLQELKFEPSQAYNKTVEHVGTASLQNEIAGKKGGKWSAKAYLMPAAAGTAPDIGEIIKAALGSETISGGTHALYGLIDTAPASLQLVRSVGSPLYEIATGCWVEQVDVEVTGGSEPTITFSGGFSTFGFCRGGTTVNGAHSISATTITLASGGGAHVGVNAYVKFGSEDNGGAGYLVTAVSGDDLTITPGLAAGLSGGEAVEGNVPSQTLGGSTQGGVEHDLQVDSTSVGMVSSKTSIKTGILPLDKEATSAVPTGLIRGMREITGELQMYFDDATVAPYLGNAWSGTTHQIDLRHGPNTAGSRITEQVLAARFEVTPIDVPDEGEAAVSISWVARQSAAAADEYTIKFH